MSIRSALVNSDKRKQSAVANNSIAAQSQAVNVIERYRFWLNKSQVITPMVWVRVDMLRY